MAPTEPGQNGITDLTGYRSATGRYFNGTSEQYNSWRLQFENSLKKYQRLQYNCIRGDKEQITTYDVDNEGLYTSVMEMINPESAE